MNRRRFVVGVAATAAASVASGQSDLHSGERRRSYGLNHNWTFSRAPNMAGAVTVTLPHTNAILPWHSFNDKGYEFISYYERRFQAPDDWRDKRVFIDFDGAMTAATVGINGFKFPEYRGGYTPFSHELTGHLKLGGENVITVQLDSTERPDIPPFGGNIDYLTFGGIYRDVRIRVVPAAFIENVYAKPVRVAGADKGLVVRCTLNGAKKGAKITVELRDGGRLIKSQTALADASAIELTNLGPIQLWDLRQPHLYDVAVRLDQDVYQTRIGFREARFTPAGFLLNGQVLKLRGLNRHQTFPYVGAAMPARVQRRDAEILRNELKLNLVRTSHYPQSPAFLDACDELGLLVLEEIPGWQHIGDEAWQDVAVRNVGEMIRRDWNHPSIILWGVRINESQDNHAFYTRTNQLAHALDDARQTGGIRYLYDSELLEDVFTMNDFGFPLRPPNHPLYLNTEFNGHMYSTKRFDNVTHIAEHVRRHARVHNQLAGDDRYAGGIGWCAFDYNTHGNFGSGDRICYHGVSDIFRIPKPAAGVYKSQCDPAEEVVIEPGFFWSSGDKPEGGGPGRVPISSNCERLKLYYDGKLKAEVEPDRATYPNLKHPLFDVDLSGLPLNPWGDLRIEGLIGDKLVKTVTLSGSGVDADLKVEPDSVELLGDGRDATRVVLRVTDEYGNIRPFASGAVSLSLSGPAEIVGENPFALSGGGGAVWIKTKEASGVVRLEARHPYLKAKTVEIQVRPAERDFL